MCPATKCAPLTRAHSGSAPMPTTPTPVVFIPALLSDEAMYREVIEQLGGTVEAQVMVLSEPTMQANVEAVLAKAPPTFFIVGTSYGGSIALEVAHAAPDRVTAVWLMGCNPAAPDANVQELVGGLEAMPDGDVPADVEEGEAALPALSR